MSNAEWLTHNDTTEPLDGWSILNDVSMVFDPLTPEQFKRLLEYIMALYWKVRNKKTTSIFQSKLVIHVGTKSRLVFLEHHLELCGDRAMMDCAYAELPVHPERSGGDCEIVTPKTKKPLRASKRALARKGLRSISFGPGSTIAGRK